jgi:hypothetical protein
MTASPYATSPISLSHSSPTHQPARPLAAQVPTSIAEVSIEDNWYGTTHDIIIPGAQPAEEVQEPAKEQEAAEQEAPKAGAPKAEVKVEAKAEPAVACEHRSYPAAPWHVCQRVACLSQA